MRSELRALAGTTLVSLWSWNSRWNIVHCYLEWNWDLPHPCHLTFSLRNHQQGRRTLGAELDLELLRPLSSLIRDQKLESAVLISSNLVLILTLHSLKDFLWVCLLKCVAPRYLSGNSDLVLKVFVLSLNDFLEWWFHHGAEVDFMGAVSGTCFRMFGCIRAHRACPPSSGLEKLHSFHVTRARFSSPFM